jgi:hypothetical protein
MSMTVSATPSAARAAARASVVGIALAAAMAATRVHGAGLGAFVPDASVAVFFLAGYALASPAWFGAFIVEAVLFDVVAIGFANVPAVCVTWGYAALLPAYGALWLAGRCACGVPAASGFGGGVRIGAALLAGVIGYFAISNLGYYVGGGFAATLGGAGYAAAVARYFPLYFGAAGIYTAAGLALVAVADRRARRRTAP